MKFSPNYPALRMPEGGSLNGTAIDHDEFVKDYAGTMARGSEKLIREFAWLSGLPDSVAARFPRVTRFHHDPTRPLTELRLEMIPEQTLAKAILLRKITPARVEALMSEVFTFLTTSLYPLRGAEIAGPDMWRRFHARRMADSIRLLSAVPEIRELVEAPTLEVNGLFCPSPDATLNWIDDRASRIFRPSRLVAAHGDTHMDNILVTTTGARQFWLIDPRGEELIAPSYDAGKALKSMRTGYDLVHYGFYGIERKSTPSGPSIQLEVSNHFAESYDAGMAALLGAIPDYARAEGVPEGGFIDAMRVAEYAHIVSFASYHANRPEGCDAERVAAFLATAGLLARDLMKDRDVDLTKKIPIWGPGE